MTKYFFIGITIVLFFARCKNKSEEEICQEAIIDPVELMSECRTNELSDSATIASNLIGEWNLIAYDCIFCNPKELPDVKIYFMENTGVYVYHSINGDIETVNFNWEIEKVISGSGNIYYKLITDPYRETLAMATFCDNYCFLDFRVNDGGMYLYQKKN